MAIPLVAGAAARAGAGAAARGAAARGAAARGAAARGAARKTAMLRNAKTGRFVGSESIAQPPSVLGQEKTNSMLSMIKDTFKMGIDAIVKPLKKMLRKMEEASPLLKQQLMIAKKGFLLILRPFGDLMGKLMRPFLILFLKVGLFLYKYFSKLFGTQKPPTEDLKKQLELEQNMARIRGDEDLVAELQKQIDALKKAPDGVSFRDGIVQWMKKIWSDYIIPGWEDVKDWSRRIWDNYIMAGWDDVKYWAKRLWEFLSNFGEEIRLWAGKIWDNYIAPAWEATQDWAEKMWDEYIAPWLDPVLEWAEKMWDEYIAPWLDPVLEWAEEMWNTYIDPWLSPLLQWGQDMWDKYIAPPFKWVSAKIRTIWDMIKSAIDSVVSKLKSWIPSWFKKDKKDDEDTSIGTGGTFRAPKSQFRTSGGASRIRAVGGNIGETGTYMLHAGERVITAADNQRMQSGGKSVNISNNFTINASINEDMDIRKLARKLADYNEVELRRRVSY